MVLKKCMLNLCEAQPLKTNAGQLGLWSSQPESSRPRSSWPGQISAWSHIKPGWNVFNKIEFIQQKLEERCLMLRNIILCAPYSSFYTAPVIYRTRDTLYQLMSVDIK